MPRRPVRQRNRIGALDESIKHLMFFGTAEYGTPAHNLYVSRDFDGGLEEIRATWKRYRKVLLTEWVKDHPGTRPRAWWEFDAPREPVEGWPEEQFDSVQRKRLGGTGTPSHEALNVGPHFDRGIPTNWVDQWQVDYYNGRAKDIHGSPIGKGYKEGHFKGVAIDPEDSPLFESEAAYLQRHGLLTEAEKKLLTGMPEVWESEAVCGEDNG